MKNSINSMERMASNKISVGVMVRMLPNRKADKSGVNPGAKKLNIIPTAIPKVQNTAIAESSRENIYLNGTVLGLTPKYIDEKLDEIVDFSELREFLDVPLKNYSSGMVARIAFAIATITKPDVLIADEILSVGDFMFQEKCEERMRQLMSGGTTVLLVSHSIGQIERMCDHVTWLEKGRVKMQGEAAEVCAAYKALDPEAAAIQNANSNKRIIEAP